jgi:hypothetical protein
MVIECNGYGVRASRLEQCTSPRNTWWCEEGGFRRLTITWITAYKNTFLRVGLEF